MDYKKAERILVQNRTRRVLPNLIKADDRGDCGAPSLSLRLPFYVFYVLLFSTIMHKNVEVDIIHLRSSKAHRKAVCICVNPHCSNLSINIDLPANIHFIPLTD